MNFRLIVGTVTAMLAFAGNSILCRLALEQGSIDPASFTSVRLFSGALMLSILLFSIPKLMLQKTAFANNGINSSAVNIADELDHAALSVNKKSVNPEAF